MFATFAPVGALLSSTFLVVTAAGLTLYLVPLRAVIEGWSTLTVSLVATSYAVAFTAICSSLRIWCAISAMYRYLALWWRC